MKKAIKDRIAQAIATKGYESKEMWTYNELKEIAALARVAVTDVMFYARYCR